MRRKLRQRSAQFTCVEPPTVAFLKINPGRKGQRPIPAQGIVRNIQVSAKLFFHAVVPSEAKVSVRAQWLAKGLLTAASRIGSGTRHRILIVSYLYFSFVRVLRRIEYTPVLRVEGVGVN